MLFKMYAVFDAKASAFGMPFVAFNDAVAQRNIAAAMQSGETLFSKFPEDYQLYRVGTFDDGRGELVGESPVVVCTLTSLREIVHAS